MENASLYRLISRLHKHATLMSAARRSVPSEEKEDRTLSEKRLSLSNNSFRIGDAIEWLQKQEVCAKTKNTTRAAWKQIVLMTKAGVISPVSTNGKLYDAKTWYVQSLSFFHVEKRIFFFNKILTYQVLFHSRCN